MSVRRRTWTSPDGSPGEAWVADYVDQAGHRRTKSFKRKRDADAFHARAAVEISQGIHTADSASITVVEAGRLWLKTGEANGLERTTLNYYRQHVDLHITPLIGSTKLSQLSAPMVRQFEDELRKDRSAILVRRVMASLAAILSDAVERGHVAQNVVRAMRARRQRGKDRRAENRQRGNAVTGTAGGSD